MALCDLCSRLTIANLYPPSIYYHGENLAAVQESGQTCQLCKLIHWCCTLNDSESESCLQTQFEGAVNEVTPYEEKEERGHSSIKLQLMPGTWYNEGKPNELKHIGIWMKSKYMVSSMTLLVEEGSALCQFDPIHFDNRQNRGRVGHQSIDYRWARPLHC
jgi:hypothetical protein